jgi:hypothetical protein
MKVTSRLATQNGPTRIWSRPQKNIEYGLGEVLNNTQLMRFLLTIKGTICRCTGSRSSSRLLVGIPERLSYQLAL